MISTGCSQVDQKGLIPQRGEVEVKRSSAVASNAALRLWGGLAACFHAASLCVDKDRMMLRHKGPRGTCSSVWAAVRPQATATVVEVLLWCISYGPMAPWSWNSSSPAILLSEGRGSREVKWEQFPKLPLGKVSRQRILPACFSVLRRAEKSKHAFLQAPNTPRFLLFQLKP